jgi:hypothetical protein
MPNEKYSYYVKKSNFSDIIYRKFSLKRKIKVYSFIETLILKLIST